MGEDDDFAVLTAQGPGGGLAVLVVGELDLATSPQLVRTVRDELERQPSDVAVVLDAVTFMDSTGLVALLELRDAVRLHGCGLTLVSPSPAVRFVLEVSGLDGEFVVDP